jgi:hypothetical protein
MKGGNMNTRNIRVFKQLDTPKNRLGYLLAYENNFEQYRNKVKVFCELGVNAGQSLIGWSRYFPTATIIGVDLPSMKVAKTFANGGIVSPAHQKINKRIKVHFGDAMDKIWLKELSDKYGGFDIVLDDCSHLGIQMKTSFEALWESTKFVYAVEDLDTQVGNKHGNRYIQKINFITDYIQTLITHKVDEEKITQIVDTDVSGKSKWESNDDTISRINFQKNVIFIHKQIS